MKAVWKERLTQMLFVVGGVILYLVLRVMAPSGSPVSDGGMIARDGYGGDGRTYQVYVEAVDENTGEIEKYPVKVSVAPRSYTREEAELVFERVMAEMETRIRGDNPSLLEVTQDLHLPKSLDDAGIRLRWYSSEPELLSASGTLNMRVDEAKDLSLHVQLTAGTYKADYEIPVRVVPAEESEDCTFLSGLEAEIKKQEEAQKYTEYVSLPIEYEGKQLRYAAEQTNDYVILPFLGILMALIWPARRQSEQRKREKQREQELLLDYAEIISKLMIFIGAGMTVRNAWARMAADYEDGRTRKTKPRAAYEEMRYTWYQLKNGVSESKAYQDFGRRCRLQPYLKLSSLLEQNLRTGTKDLRKILQAELADAFELRKNLARRMGEEAGTKLLLPLFLMLGIVMVMIMVPAMMTMG